MRWSDNVVFITGGATGFGRSFARAFALRTFTDAAAAFFARTTRCAFVIRRYHFPPRAPSKRTARRIVSSFRGPQFPTGFPQKCAIIRLAFHLCQDLFLQQKQ